MALRSGSQDFPDALLMGLCLEPRVYIRCPVVWTGRTFLKRNVRKRGMAIGALSLQIVLILAPKLMKSTAETRHAPA
jgi:hypothetical protein